MTKKRLTCIFNFAPHYRLPIYRLIDRDFEASFYFGKNLKGNILSLDVDELLGFKSFLINQNILGSNFVWQAGAVKAFLKHRNTTFILTGSPFIISNWIIGLLGLLLGKKVWVWTHGMKGEKRGKRKMFEKAFYRLFDKLLLYGHYSEKVMEKEGFKRNRLVVIYNSLDYNKQVVIRQQIKYQAIFANHFGNHNKTLIYVGRLQKVKKLDMILRAMHLLNPRIKVNLVLVGKDTDGSNLIELTKELRLNDQVWFYGETYDEKEIAQLFNEADICISPGPIGLTAIHAATFGVPLITNDNFSKQMPEFEVIKEGVNGSFFKECDISDLALKIRYWCEISDEKVITARSFAMEQVEKLYNPEKQIEIIRTLVKQ